MLPNIQLYKFDDTRHRILDMQISSKLRERIRHLSRWPDRNT